MAFAVCCFSGGRKIVVVGFVALVCLFYVGLAHFFAVIDWAFEAPEPARRLLVPVRATSRIDAGHCVLLKKSHLRPGRGELKSWFTVPLACTRPTLTAAREQQHGAVRLALQIIAARKRSRWGL